MEKIWAPWRMTYIEENVIDKRKTTECVFCQLYGVSSDDMKNNLVLYRDEHSFVVMNKYPYNNGHLLVMPALHCADLTALPEDVFAGLHNSLKRAINVLKGALSPDGINLGMNLGAKAGAGIPDHIHYHLVPRWSGDTNFMPVIAETKVISQHILATYDQLKPHFS